MRAESMSREAARLPLTPVFFGLAFAFVVFLTALPDATASSRRSRAEQIFAV
jgi:hypothetical protein